jgi:hypothetical protein
MRLNALMTGMKKLRFVALLAAAHCLCCATMPGQNLPALGVVPSTNHTVLVSWPHTNSTFVLQDAIDLAGGAWRSSTLLPAFNSNSSSFSVSARATNVAKFFRLRQPVDLRGIYVYSGDVYQISTTYSNTLASSLRVPGVDGLVLVAGWASLQPTRSQFNWTNFDQWTTQAVALGKKLELAIPAGSDIPSWLFQPVTNGGAGAAPLNFTVSPHEGATSNCIFETITAPWDTNFLAAWNNLLTNLSAHLKSQGTYGNVTLLRLTGINRTTDELRLPAETPGATGLTCVSNAPAIWQAAGYTPSNLLFGWSNILNSFEAGFPDKPFSVAIIPSITNSFPPIDSSGQLITNNFPDPNQPLLALAGQSFPGRLVIQFNFLITGQNASVSVVHAMQQYGSLPAYQSNNYLGSSGSGAACGGTPNSPVPCADDTYLAELQEGIYPLNPTNSLRSQYIEVFPANATAFTNAIWQAHSELFGGP